MPSVNPDFEYDIFVSYRQNDNRSGWVSDFLDALREELATTIKYPVSIYFDNNPADGLLETHNVDKSLEGKLKSLILLPILSQTYCDTRSFAWQNEFCAFNRSSIQSKLGRDIQLSNGNVSSRILPIKIHDLDADDKLILENELGSMVRGIDFIYREPGVNRPLKPGDTKKDNQNKTDFGNQVNKVANAIKEILTALRNTGTVGQRPETKLAEKEEAAENSVAVLPFANLSNDASQEYFADGITDNILGQLATLPHLRVISRTSVMRYKKTTLSAPEIAAELGVRYLLEGSAQIHGQRIRIQAQLIDPEKDQSIWSKTFLESYDDLFAIQDSVATTVARELLTTLSGSQVPVSAAPTRNLEAYDLFLKGRHAFNKWGLGGYREATSLFEQAIEKDPDFQQAYSYLASSYSARMSWNGDLSPAEAVPSITKYLEQAWRRGPTDNDYLTKGFLEFFANKNVPAAEQHFREAVNLNPNNALALYTWCYALQMDGRLEEASRKFDRAELIEPRSIAWFNYHSLQLYLGGAWSESLQTLNEATRLFPGVLRLHDIIARVQLTRGAYKETVDTIQTAFRSSTLRPPSMVAFLASACARLHDAKAAKELLKELIERSENSEKGVNIYITHVQVALGDLSAASDWYQKALASNDVDLIWWKVDPLLKTLRESILDTPDFAGAEQAVMQMLKNEMPNLSYHNVVHIQDVLHAAVQLANLEGVPEGDIKLLRLAALLHDAGYVRSTKDHETHSAQMARELLPRHGVNPVDVERVVRMILATRLPQSPANNLEEILCDADLDYLGREDFPEISQRLFAELKATGIVANETEWNRMQISFLQSHKYRTQSAQKLRQERKLKWLASIRAATV